MDDRYCLTPSQIVMYTTTVCSDCLRAKAFFEAHHVHYLQIAVEGNAEATRFIAEVNHGSQLVPTIVFPDGAVLVEPSWEDLRSKLQP